MILRRQKAVFAACPCLPASTLAISSSCGGSPSPCGIRPLCWPARANRQITPARHDRTHSVSAHGRIGRLVHGHIVSCANRQALDRQAVFCTWCSGILCLHCLLASASCSIRQQAPAAASAACLLVFTRLIHNATHHPLPARPVHGASHFGLPANNAASASFALCRGRRQHPHPARFAGQGRARHFLGKQLLGLRGRDAAAGASLAAIPAARLPHIGRGHAVRQAGVCAELRPLAPVAI